MHHSISIGIVVLGVLFLHSDALGQDVQLDQKKSGASPVTATIEVENVDASRLITVVNGIFAQDLLALDQLSLFLAEKNGAIVASGPAGDVEVVENLVRRLDAIGLNKLTTSIYRLKNAPAQDVAQAIIQWQDDRSKIRCLGVEHEISLPKATIVPELVSNSLIVSATDEAQHGELDEIIRALDKRPEWIKVKVSVFTTDANGKKSSGKGQIVTVEGSGRPATLEFDNHTIVVTPYVIKDDEPTVDVIRQKIRQ